MKKLIATSTLLSVFFILANLNAAERVLNYGFEDWGGSIASTPGYIFTSVYDQYCTVHADASEVVTSYNANEMGQTWTPHSGSYFYLGNDSPDYPLNPSVTGITVGTVNAHNNIGFGGGKCGDDSFVINTHITTGEILIRFWARHNKGWRTIQGGGRCKWIRVYTDGGTDDTVYMHLTTSSISPDMYFYCGNEGYWLGSGVQCSNAYDGNWHKWAFYIDFNNGEIYGWYDVANETLTNYTKYWAAGDGKIGNATKADYIVLKSNFSAKSPTEECYHAIDDVEIWDRFASPPDPPNNLTIAD